MAVVTERGTTGSNEWLNNRPQVGHETILADRQVINLSAGARVLVFENGDLACIARYNALAKLLIDGGQYIAAAGEETADCGKAVPKIGGIGRLNRQWAAVVGQPVSSNAVHTVAANSPNLIAKVLLDQGNFGLHGELNIGERSGFT